MQKNQAGYSLVELLVVVMIIGCLTAVNTSAIAAVSRLGALRGAVAEMRAEFRRVRMLAIAQNRNVAMRFRDEGDGWSWKVYADGDGDGVRNDDIASRVDKPVDNLVRRMRFPARIGLPPNAILDPFNGKLLSSRPPVRLGASGLCSFSGMGEATNGSVVVTDGRSVAIIQIYGATARVNVLRWTGNRWRAGL